MDDQLTPLFNPRKQEWSDHFRFDAGTMRIESFTPEGRVTVFLLQLNGERQMEARALLLRLRRYPGRRG